MNPFSPKLFEQMEKIKKNFDIINERKKDPKITEKEKDKINEELKDNKQLCQKLILDISSENSFFNKIFSLENILKSSEKKQIYTLQYVALQL